MTAFLLGLAVGAGGFAAISYLYSAPAGKFAWLDSIRAKLGKKP